MVSVVSNRFKETFYEKHIIFDADFLEIS